MRRIARWWNEFLMIIKPVHAAMAGGKKAWAIAGSIFGVSALVALGAAIRAWQIQIPGWWFAAVPAALYLFWIGGLAWAKTAGPEISMGDLEYNSSMRTYFVRITSVARCPCLPYVSLTKLAHADGRLVPAWRGQIDAQWDGYRARDQVILTYKGSTELAGILKVTGSGSHDIALSIFPCNQTMRAVSEGIDPDETLLATVSAYCESQPNGERGNEIVAQFRLVPDRNRGWYEYAIIRNR